MLGVDCKNNGVEQDFQACGTDAKDEGFSR
jgi:hypothetical protein